MTNIEPITEVNIHAEAEQIVNAVFGTRPTPEEIDALAAKYLDTKARVLFVSDELRHIELEAIAMVKDWGSVPAHAEKSRRLVGKLSEFTVTKADAITINFERVETLREALEANGHGEYFKKLFAKTEKYELVEGAEAALKTESLPKRLSEKVLNLWGRCIAVKPKKPSLKVTIADPAKPAKKTKKGGR